MARVDVTATCQDVPVITDDDYQAQVYDAGLCDNGAHVADSDGAFSIAVWGWGDAYSTQDDPPYNTPTYADVSYGYVVPGNSVRTALDAGSDTGVK